MSNLSPNCLFLHVPQIDVVWHSPVPSHTAQSSRNSKEWLLLVGRGADGDGRNFTNRVSLLKWAIYCAFCQVTFCTPPHPLGLGECAELHPASRSSWSWLELGCGPDLCDSCPPYPGLSLPCVWRRLRSPFPQPWTVPSLFWNYLLPRAQIMSAVMTPPPSQGGQTSVFYWFLSTRRCK